jgi:hypothetical protein
MKKIITIIFLIIASNDIFAQSLPIGFPVLDEGLRRAQLLGKLDSSASFLLRPLNPRIISDIDNSYEIGSLLGDEAINSNSIFKFWKERGRVQLLPFQLYTEFNTHHPYPQVNGPMVVNNGIQTFSSVGIFSEIGPLSIQFQPEHVWAQNSSYYVGGIKSLFTEYIERPGIDPYSIFLWGQSSIRLNFGAFSAGISNENIWWGPGQYNSLIFSNNAFGFKHLTLNTRKPAKTFLGSFEGQIIMGKLEGSEFPELSNQVLLNDWRYLNGIILTYQPKWIPGLFLGGTRVFQQYDSYRGQRLEDYFPVINPFQKEVAGFDMDEEGRDQQATFFMRYMIPKANMELYFEFGRRDHAVNWREFLINPEHSRAYMMGFIKLFPIENNTYIQVRGEMLHQQESINILGRYAGTGGQINWSGHGLVNHGFTHRGQMLGPGVGPSSNVQTLETAWVKGTKKLGVRLDRLNRHQDMFVKHFNDATSHGRWVDLNLGLLADWQFDRLLLSSQLFFINSLNYQWQLHPNSTPELPKGNDVFNFQGQVRAAYLF